MSAFLTVAAGVRRVVRLRRMMRGPMRPTWDDTYETLAMILHHYAKRSTMLPVEIQRRVAQANPNEGRDSQTQCDSVSANGVPAAWFSREDTDHDRVLMYLHGGGYVLGSIDSHWDLLSRLCRATGARTFAPEYRLAPEHPFPAQIEDALTAYRFLLESGVDPKRIVIGGESAGGGLTMSLLVELRDGGLPLPAGAFLISPWLDLLGHAPSRIENERFDYLNRKVLKSFAKHFVRDDDLNNPLASPLYADLHDLPPMLIHVGGAEVLLDDSTRMADRAKDAGVEVELEVWEDMIHAWHVFAVFLPRARKAIERIGEYVRARHGAG